MRNALAWALIAAAAAGPAGAAPARPDMARLPGGTFVMGTDKGFPYEGPAHTVTVKPFALDTHEVTVAQFGRFVRATGYKTEAEKFGWSGVFDVKAGQWTRADGASWRRPEGPGRAAPPDEPVTQVSWADAAAYCKWAGKRLPTEAEWEFAARGGQDQLYAWGHHLRPGGKPAANWWQGVFPTRNTGEDGYLRRAPVGRFAPNAYGLYDLAGNVWEWTQDWFSEKGYAREPAVDPRGPASGSERVIRGGSWMCSENYCTGYRVAARSHSAPDSGLNNLGFRCAR
ncbi:MAG TPA: formylglycine-generating enzyme family protein [Vicinamibacteria bacterium]|nr:formylglycine-generating enzyme family protein [Vicinamibacteria bacterium]